MTLTKSQKIAFGLLAAGLCALAADHFFSDSGVNSDAVGTDLTVSTAGGESAVNSTVSANSTESWPATLSRLAREFHSTKPPRDAFEPASIWTAERTKPTTAPAAAAVDDRPDRFRAGHTLRAVIQSSEHSQAWVDGSLVGIGQSIDGFTLVLVEPMQATFECDGKRAVLRLPDADATAQASGLP